MTAYAASHPISQTYSRQGSWPWVPAIVLLVLFAAANWAWDSSQRWYVSEAGDVDRLVDRIADGSVNRQIAFALMGLWGLYGIMLPSERPMRLKLLVAYPIGVFCIWAIFSIAWSNDIPQTAKRLVVFVAMLLAILGTIRRYDIRQIAQMAFIASVLTLIAGIFNETRIFFSDFPGFSKWRFGGTMHPNHAGLNAIVIMLSSLYLFRLEKRYFYLITLAAGVVTLMVTKSRTSLMTGVTAITVFMLLATSIPRAALALLAGGWLIAAALWLSSLEMLPDLNDFVGMGRDDVKKADATKLTGRTDIWKFAVMQGAKDPNRFFTGYGYETFWTPENARGVSDFVKFRISEGHCVYLDWYLELGIVGVSLYVFVLVVSLFRWGTAAITLQSPTAALCAAILAGAVLHGFAESSSGDASLPTFMSYSAMACAAMLRPDEDPEL